MQRVNFRGTNLYSHEKMKLNCVKTHKNGIKLIKLKENVY